MLPNLEVLKLKHACQGKKWKPSEEGFRQLKRLVIESKCLEYWNAVGDHFPVLERLELSDCDSLRKIPIEFADITTLVLIQLKKCRYSVFVSALCIQDEQRSTEACLLRLHGIFKQAVKQTDCLKKKLIKIQSEHQCAKGPSILGRMRQRRLLLGSTSSQPADPQRQNNITLEKLIIRGWHLELQDRGIQWATSFLPNLKKLSFFKTELPWSNMRFIGMLPNLEVLKLKHACQGKKWKPSEEGFRQLKRLVIESKCLEYWNAVGDHFPVLERLELSDCDSLRKIPIEFADITTLVLIQLKKCRYSVFVSALCIQDEQRRYGNDGLCVRSKHTQVSRVPNGL
nr:putative late blight resistance protein homolog R1B-16 isoform X1 [Ipomoea batatas]